MVKRQGSKHLRLSVSANGEVRVSLPYWAPYASGIYFARSRRAWIMNQVAVLKPIELSDGDRIGKAHRLYFLPGTAPQGYIRAKIEKNSIKITTNLPFNDRRVQQAAIKASERALRKEAHHLLVPRLEAIARQHGFKNYDVKIRKLTSRWGSCSNQQVITLSYFLVQLPWRLIDYVLLHELIHTKHLHHGGDFWDEMTAAIPDVKTLRKEIRAYKPRVDVLSA